MNVFDLTGLTINDFTWYEVGEISALISRGLPQVVDELAVDGSTLTVLIVSDMEIPGYDEMKVALVFNNLFLPVYENGDFYIKPDSSYATRKRSDGYVLLGVRNAS